MDKQELPDRIKEMKSFLDKFILFHLGHDAVVELKPLPEGGMAVAVSHIRIENINFELDPAALARFEKDIPSFEDYLLELLTRYRRGLTIDN